MQYKVNHLKRKRTALTLFAIAFASLGAGKSHPQPETQSEPKPKPEEAQLDQYLIPIKGQEVSYKLYLNNKKLTQDEFEKILQQLTKKKTPPADYRNYRKRKLHPEYSTNTHSI